MIAKYKQNENKLNQLVVVIISLANPSTASGRRRYSVLHVVGVLVLGIHLRVDHLVVEAPLLAPDWIVHLLLRFRGKQVAPRAFPAVVFAALVDVGGRIIWRLDELVLRVVLVVVVGWLPGCLVIQEVGWLLGRVVEVGLLFRRKVCGIRLEGGRPVCEK